MVPDIFLVELVEGLHLLSVLQPDGEAQQPVQDLGPASLLAYRTCEICQKGGEGLLPVLGPNGSQSLSSVNRIVSGKQEYNSAIQQLGILPDLHILQPRDQSSEHFLVIDIKLVHRRMVQGEQLPFERHVRCQVCLLFV